MLTLVRDSQDENAQSPIAVTESGIVTAVKLHAKNAL